MCVRHLNAPRGAKHGAIICGCQLEAESGCGCLALWEPALSDSKCSDRGAPAELLLAMQGKPDAIARHMPQAFEIACSLNRMQ